jgi:hypothetical protein
MLLVKYSFGRTLMTESFEDDEERILESLRKLIADINISHGRISLHVEEVDEIEYGNIKKAYWKKALKEKEILKKKEDNS